MRSSWRLIAPLALAVIGATSSLPAAAIVDPSAAVRKAAALPSVPLDVKLVGTFTGVDLSWTPPADGGTAEGVSGYVIHRVAGGVETTFPWVRTTNTVVEYAWRESERIPGATYSVAAVNAEGEGPASTPVEASPTREAITVAHTVRLDNGTTNTFAGQVASQGGTQVVPLAADGPTQQQIGSAIAASPDGREIAFAKGQLSLWRMRVDVPHAQPVMLLDGSTGIIRMAWSPDGSRIAYERLQPESYSCIEIIAATGGTPVQVGCHMSMPTWLPDSQTLVVKDGFQSLLERVQARANGAVLSSYAGTADSSLPTVSPDGRWIAYISGKALAVIPIGGGTPLFGESGTQVLASVDWSPDATRLLVNRYISMGGNVLKVLPVGANGQPGTSTAVFTRPWDETIGTAVWQGPRVAIKPTATVVGPNLTVPFDTTGMATPATVTCQLDGSPAAPCTSPYQKTGATTGTHVLRVKAVEAGGRATVATRNLNVDATAPTSVKITTPAFEVTKSPTATLAYAATDASGIGSYDVRYRYASYLTNFSAYATAAAATKATSISLKAAPGYEYCVSVRARDVVGNLSGWTAERCFSRPMDDRALTASAGWTRATNGAYYLGTITTAKTQGVKLSRTVQAKRLYLIATKCWTCGTLQVYYGGKSVGVVDLFEGTTELQAVIPLPVPTTFLSGTVQLVVRDVLRTNQIDGLAVRRS